MHRPHRDVSLSTLFQAFCKREIHHFVKQLLDREQRLGIVRGKRCGQRKRLVHQLVIRHDFVYRAEFISARGSERLAPGHEFKGGLAADLAHEVGKHDRRQDAVPDFGIAELHGCGSHDHVGGQCEARPAAHGRAAHRGDHRFAHMREDQVRLHREFGAMPDAGRLVRRQVLELTDVRAGAEGAPRARQHDDRHRFVTIGLFQPREQGFCQRRIERIEFFGSVQCEDPDAAAVFAQHYIVCHRAPALFMVDCPWLFLRSPARGPARSVARACPSAPRPPPLTAPTAMPRCARPHRRTPCGKAPSPSA